MEDQEYYESLDKRSKEYKEWKKSFEEDKSNEGLGVGNVVESITKATGIKKAVEFLAGEDCGCDKRKEKLNKLKIRKTINCLTEKEYEFLAELKENPPAKWTHSVQEKILRTQERVFNMKYSHYPSCGGCITQAYNDLMRVFDTYQ